MKLRNLLLLSLTACLFTGCAAGLSGFRKSVNTGLDTAKAGFNNVVDVADKLNTTAVGLVKGATDTATAPATP